MTAISIVKQEALTWEEAMRLLSFNPETGILRWRIGRQGVAKAGSIAGTVNRDGYRVIKVNGRPYKAHRVGWLMVKGYWPQGELDHRDGNRANNAISNLRLASGSQNLGNQKLRSTNTSRCKGVSWHRTNKHWWASINVDGRKRSLGFFTDLTAACRAYCAAAREHFGPYARCAETQMQGRTQ